MNITNDERRVIILRRLEHLRTHIWFAMGDFDKSAPNDVSREKLRLRLAEIADGLGKACD